MRTEETMASTESERPAPETLIPEDVGTLEKLFSDWRWIAESEKAMPPVSPLVFRLLSMDRDAPLAVPEMTEIIESDPVVTARLLGLANSSAFLRAGKPIRDVRGAILRLGVHSTFETTFTEIFGMWVRHSARAALPDDELLEALWLEYLLTGFCTRELASTLRDSAIDPSAAYTAGLLHDVGTLALCWAQPVVMGRLVRAGCAVGTPLHQLFVEAHTGLGAALLGAWNAPRELAQVAAHHHDRMRSQQMAITTLVYIADHLHDAVMQHESNHFSAGLGVVSGCFGGATEEVSAALAALGLTDKLDGIIERVALQGERIEALAALT
jgi:HD-like signal output (HDOD) protein